MKVHLRNLFPFEIDRLNFLSGDVLTMLKLKDILLAIYYFQGSSSRQQAPDIATVKPTILIDSLLGLVSILIVTQENARPTNANLSSRAQPPLCINILVSVVHLRDIFKLELNVALR